MLKFVIYFELDKVLERKKNDFTNWAYLPCQDKVCPLFTIVVIVLLKLFHLILFRDICEHWTISTPFLNLDWILKLLFGVV